MDNFLGHPLPMKQDVGWKRVKAKLEEMGIGFIPLLREGNFMMLPVHERETAKHRELADYFSTLILERLGWQ